MLFGNPVIGRIADVPQSSASVLVGLPRGPLIIGRRHSENVTIRRSCGSTVAAGSALTKRRLVARAHASLPHERSSRTADTSFERERQSRPYSSASAGRCFGSASTTHLCPRPPVACRDRRRTCAAVVVGDQQMVAARSGTRPEDGAPRRRRCCRDDRSGPIATSPEPASRIPPPASASEPRRCPARVAPAAVTAWPP